MSDPEFYPSPQPINVATIAQHLGAELVGDPKALIEGVAPIDDARPGAVAFVDKAKYRRALAETKATAVIINSGLLSVVPEGVSSLVVADPYRAYAQVAALLFPEALRPIGSGIHGARVSVHGEARLEDDVVLEPSCVVSAGAQIGSGTTIGANSFVGPNCVVGRNCDIGPNAVIQHCIVGDNVIIHPCACIGQDGFGFAPGASHLKVPQLGRVIIQDNVDIGANTTIDRGTTSDTIVGEGTKIDNQVQIGHNCVIGRHCFIVAKVGLAGSSIIGDYVTFAGASATVGHVTVGSHSQIAGMSAVTEDLPPKSRVGGIPAIPIRYFLQDLAKARRRATDKERGKTKND